MNHQEESKAHSNHDEIWLLLPWYANGSLKSVERERVKAHVSVCLVCRKELAEQTMLAKHLQHEPRVEISAKPSFDRLMARIQSEPRKPALPRRPLAALSAWVNGWLEELTAPRLAATCAAVLLALALPFLSLESQQTDPAFHTVADSGSLDRYARNDLRVIFAEQMTEQAMATLIGSIHGRIVDGPSPGGVFTIRVIDSANGGDAIGHALAQLKADPAVVFAEPALPLQTRPNDGGGS